MDRLDGVEGFLSPASGASSRWRRTVPLDAVESPVSISPGRQTALPVFTNKLK